MKRMESLLVLLLCAVILALPATAQQPENQQATTSPLVQLLQSKAILTAEVTVISQASSLNARE
jgi:hypothetical protein